MDTLIQVILLGIIEGITEFLPISSTGHLLIAEHWLGARSELFNVAIQAGAILAVVVIYWQRLWNLSMHLCAAREPRLRCSSWALAFAITVVGGFVAKQLGLRAARYRGAGRLGADPRRRCDLRAWRRIAAPATGA